MQYLSYIFFRILLLAVKITPLPLLYIKSDILAWILKNVFFYRKKVITKNLDHAFPNQSSIEKQNLISGIYQNLADQIMESLMAYSKHPSLIIERFSFLNPELVQQHIKDNQNIVVMGGHLANWEWPNIAIPSQTGLQMLALNKPISNRYINDYVNRKRSQTGAEIHSIYGSQRKLLSTPRPPYGMVFISDQFTPNTDNYAVSDFFGHLIGFVHGAQQLAVKKGYPVYATLIKRKSRGRYTMEVSLIESNPKASDIKTITNKYVAFLEKAILANPSDWIWSHKRFKNHIDYDN